MEVYDYYVGDDESDYDDDDDGLSKFDWLVSLVSRNCSWLFRLQRRWRPQRDYGLIQANNSKENFDFKATSVDCIYMVLNQDQKTNKNGNNKNKPN